MTAVGAEIPKLEDYDVFESSGFLPESLPLVSLPQEYYQPWESLAANLPSLILTKRIRKMVDQLPLLSTDKLESTEQYRRAYQVLGFLAHAYIWGTDMATDNLPSQIATPWVAVSEYLQLPPIATYAAVCLWNFKQIIPTAPGEDIWDLDNLTTINTFTGSIDESWFYLVSVYFEHKGSYSLKAGLDALRHVRSKNVPSLITTLQNLAESIDHLGSVMMRMEEMCDPHVFYFRVRPYLAGWKNMADAGLDKGGVVYGEETSPRSYAGGSNAQSSLIQFLDALLGVQHFATGERPVPHKDEKQDEKPANGFMSEMRNYMPGKHREFLAEIEKVANLREFVLETNDPELTLSYDACLAMLKSFRDKHIQIITRYIILQAKKSMSAGSSTTLRSGLAKSKRKNNDQKGTGGTSLLPFLKQCRDETGDPAAGSWGKRILSDGVMRLQFSKPSRINED